MPSKKKKYNARFPAGRIKKIMQTDEEIGKVAQAVPIIISRTLELFVESLLTKTLRITSTRNAKTLSPSHMKQCIMSENRFDFLRELVKNVPDISMNEEINVDTVANESVTASSSSSGGANGHTASISVTPIIPQNSSQSTSFHQQFSYSLESKTPTLTAPMPLSSHSNSMNFYTEITTTATSTSPDSSSFRETSRLQPPLKRASTTTAPTLKKLPKLTRLNSAPSTITSSTQQKQPNFFNNINNQAPTTPQFTISIPSPHHLNEPVIKVDYLSTSTSSTASAASSPATTLFNNNLNHQQTPTIKIDFSNLYSKAASSTSATATAMLQQQPQSSSSYVSASTSQSSINGLDEDYDDI